MPSFIQNHDIVFQVNWSHRLNLFCHIENDQVQKSCSAPTQNAEFRYWWSEEGDLDGLSRVLRGSWLEKSEKYQEKREKEICFHFSVDTELKLIIIKFVPMVSKISFKEFVRMKIFSRTKAFN